ncbi:TetR family transcriptional regulator C-terminal domain-containing protein [Sedimentitalea arenosa]|uniref:TetR family transcriptional regulator C-terminal domain-containing protein n=1 Tax=Sedimentitalea arenosa TaxID=2798803 RepID=A0A8J7IL89_9RHOB|nr:TetR family transcriptional regulator C-terminal domain-containing protein [Arenibacterium arenosum]MBJ6372408.1 TetR family transcriptional regulator C-terminal domain-containing protein [Arenibacterium arenosum]
MNEPGKRTMTASAQKRRKIRDTISGAAIREFARNGLSGTSTQAIAQSAGITKAQLHYYISSKEELYRQVLGDIVKEWREIFFIAPFQHDPALAISTYIDRKIRHALKYPDISRLFANEIGRGAPEMREHWGVLKNSTEMANGVIRDWIAKGMIQPVDPLLFQMNMWAVTQSYAEYEAQARVLMDLDDDTPMNADRIIAEATQLFLLRCGLSGERVFR